MRAVLGDRRLVVAGVAGIALLALLLRLAGTGERALFFDEAYQLRLALQPSTGEMLRAVLANAPSDPLFALIFRSWTQLVGTTDTLLRIPSVMFGAATAVATVWLAWELTLDRRVALGSGLLVAIAPYAVEVGQEAYIYAFAMLATTLALAGGWRWRRTRRARDGAAFVVLAIIAVYSHYFVAAVLGLAGLVSLTPLGGPRRISVRAALFAAGIVVLSWLPWAVPMLFAWATADSRTQLVHAASARELLGALSQYSSGTGALLNAVRPLQVLGLLASGILIVRGWIVAGSPGLRGLRVMLVVASVLFIGPWLASAISGRWLFAAHLMLLILPAVAVVLTAGALTVAAAGRRPERDHARRAAIAGAAASLLVAQIGGLAINAADPPHGDDGVRELATEMTALVRPGEPVFIAPAEFQIVLEHYWSGVLYGLPSDLDLARLYTTTDRVAQYEASVARFTMLAGDAARAWLVYSEARDSDAMFVAWLNARAQLTLRASQPFAVLYEVLLR